MATPWATITEDDVLDSMTVREREDFAKVSTKEGRPDRLPGTIAKLVAEVRQAIGTWSRNTLSADAAKIPVGMHAQAVVIARHRTLTGVPNYDPGEPRMKEWEAAVKFFEQVAAGKIRPDPADDAVPNTVPTETVMPVPKINARGRLFTRRTQDGI